MDLEPAPLPSPLMILITNPLSQGSRLLMIKILSGTVFGGSQPVRLRLLTDLEGVPRAEELKQELESCSFACMDGIDIFLEFQSNDLVVSAFATANIICLSTNLPNPNSLQTTNSHPSVLNALERLTMMANFFSQAFLQKSINQPIVVTEGLICHHLLKLVCKNVLPEILYCPTPLHAIGKSVLGENLKIKCDEMKDLLIWAADDETFYIHVQRPLMKNEEFASAKSDWELRSRDFKEALLSDHHKFNDAWMKNTLIEKTKILSRKNPYGPVWKAHSVAAVLKTIWLSLGHGDKDEKSFRIYCNMGVISGEDNSYGLEKGIPCVLPLVIERGKWQINKTYTSNTHIRSEVKKIIKTSKERLRELKIWRDEARSTKASVTGQDGSFSLNEGQFSCPCTEEFPGEEDWKLTQTNALSEEDTRSNKTTLSEK